MPNDSTIPSPLGPIDTMPSQLGPAAGDSRPRRPQSANPWPWVVLLALAGIVVVYLMGVARGH